MKSSPSRPLGLLHLALITALLGAPLFAAERLPQLPSSDWVSGVKPLRAVSLNALNMQARQAIQLKPRLPLAAENDALALEAAAASIEPGRVPNYLRALATLPSAATPFAQLLKTAVYSGTLSPETKLAMGVRVAQLHRSAYVGAHTQRWLRGSAGGARWINSLNANKTDALSASDRLALRYAELLTQSIHGVDEAEFDRLRAHFNDSQIVELTLTTCFWNYFTRLSAGWNLPVEAWVLPTAKTVFSPPSSVFQAPFARVSLISPAEVAALVESRSLAAVRKSTPGAAPNAPTTDKPAPVVNSVRAMSHVPAFGSAWFNYWRAVREVEATETSVGREMLLQVSFAVSMANGCRYCTLHQVQNLRRLNVDPAKLVAMKKDDAMLTLRERAAVVFARKLTRDPASVTDADVARLEKELGSTGAKEVILQTSAFSFMNRFTDGLNLPSEDEAIKIYSEVYGTK